MSKMLLKLLIATIFAVVLLGSLEAPAFSTSGGDVSRRDDVEGKVSEIFETGK